MWFERLVPGTPPGDGDYAGLRDSLKLGRQATIARLETTGLRGRGGAGYPTAQKWQVCHDAEGEEKYAMCNAVDADPQAQTARILLGSYPHAVLEGLLIAAYAVGAAHCYVCINAEYGDESAVLRDALEQMRGRGLLGGDIMGAGFSCDITVKEVPSGLVMGEETALIRALEDKQPLPYLRLEYPAVKGLLGKPTLVNSAETLANVSAIFAGRRALTAVGDEAGDAAGEPGGLRAGATKIVTICGDVTEPCTVEVPLGTTIGALLEAVEGASPDELGVKAVQLGGPTGAFFAGGPDAAPGVGAVPATLAVGGALDTPIDYEALAAAGAIMGSATLQVIGARGAGSERGGSDSAGGICAVQMARDTMSYLQEQSCGKCTACREVTLQLTEMLEDIVEFRAKPEDLDLMLELCEAMGAGSICGLGKTAAAPLLSCLTLFPDDFAAHISRKSCPGGA